MVLALAGATLAVSADDHRVAEYARARLRGLAAEALVSGAAESLLVTRKPRRALRSLRDEMGHYATGRRMLVGDDCMLAMELAPLPGISLAWRRDVAREVQTTVLGDSGPIRFLKRLARHLPADFFVDQLVQFGGLFPLLYAAERRGWTPLHAALVATPQGGVLVAGGAGTGKSTLSVAMAARPGRRLLGDNIVLIDGARALGVPEPVKLDAWSAGAVRRAAEGPGVAGGDAGWGRREYAPPTAGDPVDVALIVLPRVAPATRLRDAEPREAAVAMSAGAVLAHELLAYSRYAAAIATADSTAPAPARERDVRNLAEGAPAVILDMARGRPLQESLDALERRLESG